VPRVSAPHRILVIGGGGREHALAWRLARDPEVEAVLVAPGNDGMADHFARLAVSESDHAAVIRACRDQRVSLVVVGPEAPLAAGLVDALSAAGIPAFGPTRGAARLEASKWFAKDVMREAGVPTGQATSLRGLDEGRDALGRGRAPYVLKADGLAAGKGVLVTSDRTEADVFLVDCFERDRFGVSGRRVLLEEFLAGDEASVMAVCDGRRFVLLPAARDYKRAFDGDQGPNTGGMGAFAPAASVDAELERTIASRIVAPTLATLARRGEPFRGVLYCGLMLTAEGPRVVEFNVRFGDPETEVVLPLLDGSLARLLASAAQGDLDEGAITRGARAAVAVALVDEDYPGTPRATGTISGLATLANRDDVLVFHAATANSGDDWRIAGGRAAYVVGLAGSVAGARARAYDAVSTLGGAGWRCRGDVAAARTGDSHDRTFDSGAGSGGATGPAMLAAGR